MFTIRSRTEDIAMADDFDERMFDERPLLADKVYFAIRPDGDARAQMRRLAEELSATFPLTGRPNFETLHVSVLGLGMARDLTPLHFAAAEKAAEELRYPPFAITFTKLMSFRQAEGRKRPLTLVAEDDSAADVNDLAEDLRDTLVESGFPPGGRAGGHAHLTLLYDQFGIKCVPLEIPVVLRVSSVWMIRNHYGEGRHSAQEFRFSPHG
jgi:2'-5' RNA ligase